MRATVETGAGVRPRGGGKPLRVLMTTDAVGGVWDYTLELVRALEPEGVEVTLLVIGDAPSEAQLRAAHAAGNLRLVATDLRLEWQPGGVEDQDLVDAILLDLERDLSPDIIHLNGYSNAAAGFRAPIVVVAHSCVSTWWHACRGEAPPAEWSLYEERLRRGLAAADCVVAPTAGYMAALVAAHGEPRSRRVIRNGRDAGRYRAGEKQPAVLAAGRVWDEAKNIVRLCEAAPRIDAPVRIAGEGALAGAPPNVTALGRLDSAALAEEMARAAIFASPARYEPFGLAVLEAALSGCALILADIPTFRELWGGAARFVDAGDAEAIAAAANALLGDPAECARAGEAARQRGRDYGVEAMAYSYLDLYRELGAGSRDRSRARSRAVAA